MDHQQQQELVFLEQEEQAYFGDYDRAVAEAAMAADYYDYNCDYEQLDEEMMEMDDEEALDESHEPLEEMQQEEDPANYDYQQDSLLHLIVGVQSYLSESQQVAQDRTDSPLLELQYKMYTYLKQRACDMGVDLDASFSNNL